MVIYVTFGPLLRPAVSTLARNRRLACLSSFRTRCDETRQVRHGTVTQQRRKVHTLVATTGETRTPVHFFTCARLTDRTCLRKLSTLTLRARNSQQVEEVEWRDDGWVTHKSSLWEK